MIGLIIICVVALLLIAAAAVIAWNVGYKYRQNIAEKAIGGAENEALRIVEEAKKTGEAKKREALVEAREEIHKKIGRAHV